MSRMQRPDNNDPNRFMIEVTSGQLIVIICGFLFVAMSFFGLGILIARLDTSLTDEEAAEIVAAQEALTQQEMDTYTVPAFGQEPAAAPAAPSATAPATPTVSARRTPETPSPRNPYMDNTPRLTALPPLSPYRSLPVEVEAPTRIPRVEEAEQPTPAPAPQAAEAAPAAPAAPPVLTPIEPDEPIIETSVQTPPAPAPQPVAPQPVAPQPAAPQPAAAIGGSGGSFGVQIAAFSGSDRRARAEAFQRRIRSEQNVVAEVIPSEDDVHYRVVVRGYDTRESAATACEALRRKTGLSEAFVRPL